uniref:ATP synthase subunit a n=1 Tax=Archipsocus nomas TaxID=239250 RepID=A0A343QCF2_9NEOP|nr:ATP synthase F0 subunit 6 [Archipsocus nomas]ATU07099.1 ATP synthase F0 subunit 6 [Archipsocus nomas]
MMTNLFSIFDPSTTIFSFSFNWLSTLLFTIFIPQTFWVISNRWNWLYTQILFSLHKEFKNLMKTSNIFLGNTLIFISLFTLLLFNNFLGLFPYIFTSSSHLVFSLTLSLPLWLTFMLFGWLKHNNHMFTHLIPQGTPAILMPFMVCIETISNIIRPFTLAIRLTANMIAGHLLMTLLGNTGPSLSLIMLNLLIVSQIFLILLESAVSLIQAYVFAILSTLYSTETN